jgi:integrase
MPTPLKKNPPFATKGKKGLIFKPFRFLFDNNATTVPQPYIHYKPARLVHTSTRSYVEYWYRVPEELYPKYKKEWRRFRVFEDINRNKNDEYAKRLLRAVKEQLQAGYNPFKQELPYFLAPEVDKAWSLNTGLDKFIEYCHYKGLRPGSIRSYQTLINFFKEYYLKGNKIYEPVDSFTKDDLKTFFSYYKKENKWSNHTYNNYVTFAKAIFNWFVKEEIISKSPVVVEVLPVHVVSHKYFTDEVLGKLKVELTKHDPYLWEFIQFTYLTTLRPKSETRFLQNKHILWERKLLFVPAHISKTNTDRFVPLGDEVLKLLENRKRQPVDYYIFGGEKPHSTNYMTNRFKPFKDKLKLEEGFTIYGAKHTRVIHLKSDGVPDADIMSLTGHTSYESYSKYLRDLGLTVNAEKLNLNTRKI